MAKAWCLASKTAACSTTCSKLPAAIGQLPGAEVAAYVWPVSLDPAEVGFDCRNGLGLRVDNRNLTANGNRLAPVAEQAIDLLVESDLGERRGEVLRFFEEILALVRAEMAEALGETELIPGHEQGMWLAFRVEGQRSLARLVA